MDPPKKLPKLQCPKGNTINGESCATILKYFRDSANVKPYTFLSRACTRAEANEPNYHPLFVGLPLNTFKPDFDGQLPEHYFEKFMYKSTYPRIISDMNHIESDDPVTKPMADKNIYILKCRIKTGQAKHYGFYEGVSEGPARCSSHHLELLGQLEADPDPLFHCHYSWYYAGNGNLHVAELDGDVCLVHSELNVLYITPFSVDTLQIDYSNSLKFVMDGNILETVHSEPYIVVRTKHQITALKLVYGDQLALERLGDHESRKPFVSVNFDPHHNNVIYATTFDNKVHIINLNFMKKRTVRLKRSNICVDNWSTVQGIDRTTYAHITKDTVYVYDKRVNKSVHTLKDLVDYSFLNCDKISVARKCEGTPLMYIGTSHHLFLLDMRYSGDKVKPVQRWTHNMISSPTYISSCKFELNKEMLCLSSQWYEDTLILTNDSSCFASNIGSNSISFPFRPPTVEDELIEARLKGLCMNVYHPIDKRLYSALTGNAVFQRGAEYLTLTQTSLGDIFCHTLYAGNENREDDSIQRLHEWSQKMNIPRNTEYTGVTSIAGTWRQLRKVPEDFTLGGDELNPDVENKFSEDELMEIFEGNKIDRGLLDVWLDEAEEEGPSLAIERDYSDSE